MKTIINYKELQKIVKYRNSLNINRVKLLNKRNKLKIYLGVGCLVIAIIPNGSGLLFYPLSFMLLGISLNDILKLKDNLKLKYWLMVNK